MINLNISMMAFMNPALIIMSVLLLTSMALSNLTDLNTGLKLPCVNTTQEFNSDDLDDLCEGSTANDPISQSIQMKDEFHHENNYIKKDNKRKSTCICTPNMAMMNALCKTSVKEHDMNIHNNLCEDNNDTNPNSIKGQQRDEILCTSNGSAQFPKNHTNCSYIPDLDQDTCKEIIILFLTLVALVTILISILTYIHIKSRSTNEWSPDGEVGDISPRDNYLHGSMTNYLSSIKSA